MGLILKGVTTLPGYLEISPHNTFIVSSVPWEVLCLYTYFTSSLQSYLYTLITHTTVGTPGWAVELTRGAPLHSDCYPIYFYWLVQWCAKVIILHFIFVG